MSQQGDVLLCQTVDDGEINIENGIVEMSPGLETAAYLALFGGNEEDDGRADNPHTWWGNLSENVTSKQYRSETQNLLQSIPATSFNLLRIEEAVKRDLVFFLEESIASSVTAQVTVPALNTVAINVQIIADGEESNFKFVENWKAST